MTKKKSILTVLAASFAFCLALVGPNIASAATSPSLGTAATYGVLTGTFNYNVGLTTITGTAGTSVLGVTSSVPGGGPPVALTVIGDTETANAAYTQAGLDQGTALNNVVDGLNVQPCMSIGAIVDIAAYDLDGAGPLPPGTFTPGCYSTTGTMNVGGGGTVTLSGTGTYIFRAGGALNTSANSIIQVAGGASVCDVFWAPVAATTLGADSSFIGTIIDDAGITMLNNVTLLGNALAYGAALGNVTVDSANITVPVCAAPPPTGGGTGLRGTITVIKNVINDNGGTRAIGDFPLFINGTQVGSGITNNYFFPTPAPYVVTETTNPNYAVTFSGDCDEDGLLNLALGENKICLVTNNDIGPIVVPPPVPPIIAVVKVPSPLALPNGPGPVEYTYTLRNVGTVPVTDITMVGDTCSPVTLISGDDNNDEILDLDETWVYTCSTTLTETHTNVITATGWANGISANDIASATVVVGENLVPPLIHVTKVPSPLTLPAEGGTVTYTNKVTNPGTVALSRVRVTDDRCSPVQYVSGDTDGDSRLDPSETWTYTCQTNLTETTLNTVVAYGTANGMTVRDFALATVVVPAEVMRPAAPAPVVVPGLPRTGVDPSLYGIPWNIFNSLSGIFSGSAFSR